ncbi:glycosyltransferase family 2 protein [Bittarella massiliensis (ex Durand et al. 2017)]|uniref:Glycosyltransferase n=1 Tax=Bittarella massiliensis (ex Durand et al. 2017) TaxID=1720313 RepID=A0AAW5K7D5_9FIRM|nr:glycosyltransferase [Bittarella massiliensis (ex Durand et al. 2017)]MCQ4948498.1 glycosyltransferase [Bittarella massiliensis (ex Durand et al. 2017)]
MEEATPTISIIVPVYKVEAYLDRCVQSILNQTFSDFELILVDDGSPDRCGQMCDVYAQGDRRVRVIHKKNGGLSDARNAGIDAARGEYLGFVDSDDEIAPDMYESLYRLLQEGDADLSVCGLCDYFADGTAIPQAKQELKGVFAAEEALGEVLRGQSISVNAVNKLYKKNLFDGIRFPVGKTTEDGFIMVKLVAKTERVAVDTAVKYRYWRREGSITTGSFSEKDWNVVEAYTENEQFVRQNYPHLLPAAEFRLIWAYKHIVDRLALSLGRWDETAKSAKRAAVSWGRKHLIMLWRNGCYSLKQKGMYTFLFCFPGAYMRVYAHYQQDKW